MNSLYLDTCSIQRPLDTMDHIRVRLEAEAILSILEQIDAGSLELISSTAQELEILRTPLSVRREHAQEVMARASAIIIVDEVIEDRATSLALSGVKAMDAFHLAAAESAGVDFFCTCDDRFLRRAREIEDLAVVVVSPLELIEVLEP